MSRPVENRSLLFTVLPVILAAFLYIPIFAVRKIGGFDFWWWMSLNASLVIAYGFLVDKSYFRLIKEDSQYDIIKKIFMGILSAVLLYGVFYVGNTLSRQLFPFAGNGINRVYDFKESASTLRIALLMILCIGPGEEIFWRGFLQRHWQNRIGIIPGFIFTTVLYSCIHIASGNIMLILAAGVCGLYWGALYIRTKSVIVLVISHTVWDLMIFLLWTMKS